VLIPFTQAAVPEVSVAAGFVRIDMKAAGLVADADDELAAQADQAAESGQKGGLNPNWRRGGPKDDGGKK
jgi:16S rRNA processing protein RimM